MWWTKPNMKACFILFGQWKPSLLKYWDSWWEMPLICHFIISLYVYDFTFSFSFFSSNCLWLYGGLSLAYLYSTSTYEVFIHHNHPSRQPFPLKWTYSCYGWYFAPIRQCHSLLALRLGKVWDLPSTSTQRGWGILPQW